MISTYQQLQAVVLAKKYRFFDFGPYNLNIVGVRSKASRSNSFDDALLVGYRDQQLRPQLSTYTMTTDPGKPWLLKPLDPKGCAVMVPGQYPSAYKIGVHGRTHASGGYEALEQVGKIAYVRDNNRDEIIDRALYQDPDRIFWDVLKTNIHHAGQSWIKKAGFKYLVGPYSAGCQVLEYYDEFMDLMRLAHLSADAHGNAFTYTLLEEEDLAAAL